MNLELDQSALCISSCQRQLPLSSWFQPHPIGSLADYVNRRAEVGAGFLCACLPILPRFFDHAGKALSRLSTFGSQNSCSLSRPEGYTDYSKMSLGLQGDHRVELAGLPEDRDQKRGKSVKGLESSGSERTSRELIDKRYEV